MSYIPYSVNNRVILKDIKSSGTNGGAFSSGAWRTRDLNTTENSQTWCSLSSNQFTLSSGKYRIKVKAPALKVSAHKSKLRNITDSTDDLIGASEYNDASSSAATTSSFIEGIIEISSTKTFEIQHRCYTSNNTNGFGPSTGFGVDEIFTQVEIEKIG